MRVCRDFSFYTPDSVRPLVLAVGNFDGVHLGHQSLLRRITEEARRLKGIPAVFTFASHPQEVLHPGARRRLLTAPEHRLSLFHKLGIELCFVVPFTHEFSRQTPEEFVEAVLIRKLKVAAVCLGFNARFGRDRAGDGALMRKLAARHGFTFEEMPPVVFPGAENGENVSSSLIRTLIENGEFEKASAALGRPFSHFARVIRGEGRGKDLGFPTANLDTAGLAMPPAGVYPAEVREIETMQEFESVGMLNYRGVSAALWHKGVLNYGIRPTFGGAAPVLEVHLLDFNGDLYGRSLEVVFHPRIRAEQAFKDVENLKNQVAEDIRQAKAYFGAQSKNPFTKAGG